MATQGQDRLAWLIVVCGLLTVRFDPHGLSHLQLIALSCLCGFALYNAVTVRR